MRFVFGLSSSRACCHIDSGSRLCTTREEAYDFEVVFLKSIDEKYFNRVYSFLPGVWRYLHKRKIDVDMVLASETFSIPSLFASLIVPRKTVIWQELGAHNRKMKTWPSRIWYNIIARCFMP